MTSEMDKDFDGWFAYQVKLENEDPPRRGFEEGEVWRCALGHNVGFEIDGKSKRYWRPVLILRKLTPTFFLGVPFTSSSRKHPFHIPIKFRDKPGNVDISQVRALDARRLQQRLGRLPSESYDIIRLATIRMLEQVPPYDKAHEQTPGKE